MTNPSSLGDELVQHVQSFRRVVIAFSGGVDSSVVAAAAARANLESCIAVTGRSPSVANWQLQTASRVAAEIGIDHRIVDTTEGEDPNYIRNDQKRCFYCKQTLYRTLTEITKFSANATIVSGTNADDLGDYRPGIQAGRLANIQTPLANLGFGKKQVRQIAIHFGLSNHDLPASPCLASRIAYGVQVTAERLEQVERAEDWIRQQGFSDCRVRFHENDLARVELLKAELPRLFDGELHLLMTDYLQTLGFRFVTVDLNGLQSGSMNRTLVSITA